MRKRTLALVGLAALGLTAAANPTWPGSKALAADPVTHGRLIVWVVDTKPDGLAIALNDLERATGLKHELFELEMNSTPAFVARADKKIGVQILMKGLLDPSPRGPRQSFLLRRYRKDGQTIDAEVAVKFAPENSLFETWQPLFKHCARKDRGAWEAFLAANTRLAWLRALGKDLAAGDPVVILGPDRSEEMPALWLALGEITAKGKLPPPIVSTAATSSLLKLRPLGPLGPGEDGARWRDAMAKMAGYSDASVSRTTGPQQAEIDLALQRMEAPFARSLLYTPGGKDLASEMVEQMAVVMGFRRIAVFHPDKPIPAADPAPWLPAVAPWMRGLAWPWVEPASGQPAHRLFGPSLADDLRKEIKQRFGDGSGSEFIPISIPAPPAPRGKVGDVEIWADPTFRDALRRELRPNLRYLKHAGVDAVGVVGEIDIKLALFALIREELPDIPLFTHDADYRLETPHAAAPSGAGAEASPRPATPADALEGLLVISAPEPPRAWVEEQLINLDPMVPFGNSTAFLPEIHAYYTYHVFWKLIELTQGGRSDGWSWGNLESTQITHDDKVDPKNACLECRLRREFSTVTSERHRAWDRRVSWKFGKHKTQTELLIIADGQLLAMDGAGIGRAIGAVATMTGLVAALLILLFRGNLRGAKPSGVSTVAVAVLLLPALVLSVALGLDSVKRPVSASVLPDGHSLLPTIALQSLAAALMLLLPSRYAPRFRDAVKKGVRTWGFDRWAPPPVSNARNKVRARFRAWISRRLLPHLKNSRTEWLLSGLGGLALTLADAWAGFPVRPGWAYWVAFFIEWGMLTLVAAIAWSYLEVARALGQLRDAFGGTSWTDAQRAAVDPEAVRRVGTDFVDSVGMALAIELLLIASRLPSLGMARWRWQLPGLPWMGRSWDGLPYGVLFFGVGVAVIVSYWAFGYYTLRGVIAKIKAARLLELDKERDRFLAAKLVGVVPPLEKDLREALEKYETLRREVEAVPERPWTTNDALRARVALATAVLPWLLPKLLGAIGGTFLAPATQAIQGLLK